MNTRNRIFAACVLGGGVGAFLAHQLFYPSGWSLLLGFLLGGLVSYLAYDFKGFIVAIPQAWRKTVDGMSEIFPAFVALAICASNVLPFFSMRLLGLSVETTKLLELILVFTLMAGMLTNLFRMIAKDSDQNMDQRERTILMAKQLNPFTNLLVGVPYLIFVIVKYTALFLPRFIWNVFILIHSELRLLCLFDGGLGAVAGALIVDSATGTLVGALAGGIFGVLNFEIISKKVLKVVRSR